MEPKSRRLPKCGSDVSSTARKKITPIRLFLSSPGDVEAERQRVHAVVVQIQHMLGSRLGFFLELIEWETHVAGDMGRPQEVINSQIGDYDIFVGIMWKRFGTPTGIAESGTEEEFNSAYANWQQFKRPRILFYFSDVPYKPKNRDEKEQWDKVFDFQEKMQEKGLVFNYQSPEKFADLLRDHLAKVLQDWLSTDEDTPPIADFSHYLGYLKAETAYMDIRGLVTGEGKIHQFGIDQLYIPLKTTSAAGRLSEKGDARAGQHHAGQHHAGQHPEEIPEGMMSGEVSLQEALQEVMKEAMNEAMHKCGLIIKGDPGAGKSTFLRLITFTLCQKWLGEESSASAAARILWPDQPPLPVLIRLGRLAEHIHEWKVIDPAHSPTHEDSPEWLLHFLDKQGIENNWQISADDFRRELKGGRCLIMLDGLDEAPDSKTRQKISSLATQLLRAYPQCCVVLTSRPGALAGKGMPDGDFALAEIAPLDEQAMKVFLTQWGSALYAEAPGKSRRHLEELTFALQARPEIRRMASTPVMLTALVVVHWNESRLPEQRAELYESIVTWLLRAREQRTGRLTVDRCQKLLQKLTLAMFTHPDGRRRQVGLRWAAEQLASEFDPTRENTAVELAECFLCDEMLDSGIIVERNQRLEFWHLSFQEYLAACEIGGFRETRQLDVLFKNERLYSSEWRETVLLLSGVLYKQGLEKINYLIDEIICRGPQKGTNDALPQLAREVGLLGGIERDLSPFKFKPANSAYPEIVRQVMGIFDKAAYRNVPVQVRIEAADALAQVGDPRFEGADPRTGPMVYIPGGKFWMGAQKDNSGGQNFDQDVYASFPESSVHQVELSAYRIGEYPVTVGQYRRFMEDGGYEEKQYWETTGGFDQFKEPDKWEDQKQYPSRPVVYVSWFEAAAYACWAGGRLPTEAEWERTARGPGQEYRKYPWGNDNPTGETANFDKSGIGKVTPVGIFPGGCSPEGAHDLAGNVWEWCWDWYSKEYYNLCAQQGVVKDPTGPEKGDGRVVRGGSFYFILNNLRCAARIWYDLVNRYNDLGFRLVCGPSV